MLGHVYCVLFVSEGFSEMFTLKLNLSSCAPHASLQLNYFLYVAETSLTFENEHNFHSYFYFSRFLRVLASPRLVPPLFNLVAWLQLASVSSLHWGAATAPSRFITIPGGNIFNY